MTFSCKTTFKVQHSLRILTPVLRITIISDIQVALNVAANSNVDVSFLWIPSHCGIQGNEAADALAKASLSSQSVQESVTYSLGHHYSSVCAYILQLWQGKQRESVKRGDVGRFGDWRHGYASLNWKNFVPKWYRKLHDPVRNDATALDVRLHVVRVHDVTFSLDFISQERRESLIRRHDSFGGNPVRDVPLHTTNYYSVHTSRPNKYSALLLPYTCDSIQWSTAASNAGRKLQPSTARKQLCAFVMLTIPLAKLAPCLSTKNVETSPLSVVMNYFNEEKALISGRFKRLLRVHTRMRFFNKIHLNASGDKRLSMISVTVSTIALKQPYGSVAPVRSI
ncbi:hypothetical protein CAPTEDRAFT_193728 [Capitella teleta]|uniref:Uncharacterized protein n=1 Tax=Capitella teleta TaxID=283909 RepID=R7U067_CAPTE|nr:hypothetical protein CAPTEDRAFT_193728 [Capitella teleta]|eukprot:ELT99252.1 hypothetical protein CAPTEDRAFT_193728 [Capitella teleta]